MQRTINPGIVEAVKVARAEYFISADSCIEVCAKGTQPCCTAVT